MAPQTGTALLILVAFVLPGFVSLLISERTHVVPVGGRSPFELLLIVTYRSVISWGLIALVSWPFGLDRADLRRMYREESLGKLAGLGLLAILVAPALIATFAHFWRRYLRRPVMKRFKITPDHAVPTAWDSLFGRQQRHRLPAMVRAFLTDGRVVAGYLGAQGFAGYGEQSQDLLLDARWTLDQEAWFKNPAPGSQGVWLSARSIVSLEVYDVAPNPASSDGAPPKSSAVLWEDARADDPLPPTVPPPKPDDGLTA
jgi:hypothetical protein